MLRSQLIPLRLVCLYILLGIPQAKCKDQLDMTPNAFDDQYIGCVTEMDECAPDLLKNETSSFSQFKEAWEKSKRHWQTVKTKISPPSGFKDEHGTAIVTYTDQNFHDIFSNEEGKPWTSNADYKKNFRFKAFHYYLTRALQLLRGKCDVMHKETVYRGVNVTRFKHTGSGFMRFGNFASSSLSNEEAEKFGNDSFFTIHTCFGVNISNFSYKPTQKEVLIPGHEKFRVVTGQGNHKFLLWSTNQTCSHFNCALLKGEKNSRCIDNSATRGGIILPSKMSPSLFGASTILIHVAALKLFTSF